MTSRKQLAINQRALYDDAVKNKMFWNATPSFQEFQRRLQNPKYVQTVQANYRAHGRSGDAFDTLSGFRDYFCVSDEDKQDMTQGVGNMIADTKARLAGQQRYNKLKQHQDKQRGRYGRLDLGVKNPLTNDNVVREPLTGRYLTSDGAEYAQEYEAARAQNHIDETGKRYTEAVERGDLPSAFEVRDEDGNYALVEDLGVKPGVHVTEKGKQQQLAGLVNTRKNVEEQYNALYRKLEEDFKRSAPFSLNTHSQYGIDDNDMRLQAYLNSNAQYRRLKAQLHQLDNAIGVGEEAVKGRAEERYVKNAKGMLGYAYRDLKSFGASALRGLWNAVSDVSTWDMGLQDLQDNMTLYTTVKKARQKGYNNLNSEERQMLDVAAKTGAYTAENQQYLGRGYKAGNVTGESLPFMVEMALNPASGLGEAAMSKYMRNAIAKYGKEAVRKEAWKYVTKKCGYRVAGDVLGAALMTGTTGSARTLADTYDRLTGDIKSTYDSNGKIVYDGTENEEKGILKAYLKAFGATAIENHSEFVGEYFNPLLKGVGTLTMKGWKKVNAKSANAFLDNLKDMGSTSTAKWLGNLFDKTQWHGTIGEYAEEVVGNIENALLVGDSTLDTKEGTGVFNLDQNIDTFLGVSLMGGFFSTLKTGAYVRDKVKGERKILMQQSLDLDNSIRYALGADPRLADKWKEWRVALAQGTDEEKKQALKEISENTNGYIKKAMYDYSANAQKIAGMDKATQGAVEDGTITPEQAQRDADIEQAHEEGLAAEGTARHDIQQEHQLKENSLARMLGISAEQLDRMEDEDIESMTGQNDALDTAIYDYQTSRERYQGVIDRATDEVEQAGIDAAHQIDLYTDHSTGQIRPCVIKGNNGKEDYQGYIVNGNIATHPDGAIDVSGSDKMILYFDPETGKIEHGDASTFASLGESADATVARQQAIDEAKQQAAQAQSRDIDGGVGEDGNVSEAMPTFPQSSDQEERNAADFDIGQVVNAETGEVIPVSFEGLAEGENAYLTGGRPDGKTKDRLKVTIVDAEGNVTNRVMKRGNVQVDGRMSAEDFRNAYEEAVSSRMAQETETNGQENNVDEEGVVAGDAAPSADTAATSEEEGAASEPAVRDKNGNPIYDKMPISATIADLYDGALDDAEIDGFVSAQIAEAEKAVEKMEKKKPKVGTDKAKYLADKKAWEEGLQEAQRKVQYWQDVKAEVEKITTPEDARGYEEELNGDAAQTAYRNGSDAAAYGVREVTAEFMQSGDVKITPESYRKETGFGAGEQRAMVGKISKGGKSIDKLAEDLEVFDRENYNGMYFGGDSSVAKDAILDYLSSPDSRKGVKKMQSEAEREYVEAYEAERDRYYQEKYHMSYEEYLVYSSQEMPELLRKYSNFDEQLFLERYADEIEAALQKREEQLKQEENGKEGNVSAGEESGHGRSNQVQSGERTDDTGRGEVGKDSAGEVGPRHEGVVESEAALGSGGSTNQQRIGRVQKETRADVADQTMTHDEAIAFIAAMENRAEVAPSVDLSIENWDSLFGLDGIVNTPIGKVKMGDNQFTKMMREDRHGKLGMVKPTLENPDAILEDASKAKAGDTEERPSSYIFVKAFKKSDGSRYYYFTSITVSKDGLEVVVSNQEKRKNAIANLLSKDKLVWKHADDVSDASDVAQGLYSSQGNVSDLATEGTDAPQTSMSNNDPTFSGSKDTNNTDTKQENEEKSVGGEKEPMSPTPAMIDRMIEEQRVDDVSELLISSELKKAAEGIAGAFGMKVVYLKKVFIRSNDPAVEDFEGNGFVRNGVIYLSLKEADIAQFTFGHELLHQLKQIDADSYMRIRQKVIDVMGRKAFEMEVKARQMTYANVPGYTLYEDYAEEVIADTLGDIITHTDMLPNIARSLKDNPSLLDRLLNVVDNVRQYFRGKTGGALGDLVNDIRDTYEMTARQGAERDKFSLRLAEAKNNTDKNPSQAQKESGNYRKGHIRFGGYNYTIENPQGSYRSGVDENGKKWKQKMNNTYGYILGIKGKDGDHLDMFINDKADLDSWNGNVYVVDQVFPDGSFDEHKVMYGFGSEEDARKAYLSNYEQGWQGLGNITGVSKEDFDRWLEKSGRKTKAFSEYKNVKSESAESPKTGAFGTVYTQFRGKAQEAFDFLASHGSGDLLGVFHREGVGDIDAVWGDKGGGLDHIIRKHIGDGKSFHNIVEAANVIDDIIKTGSKAFENGDKIVFKKGSKLVTIRKNVRNKGKKIADKNWVLTAYDELSADGDVSAIAPVNQGQAARTTGKSQRKDTTKPSYSQKKNVKSNKKIPFSLKNDRTLAGVHNITEEKLRKALKLGGFANPSVAVIDTSKNGHEKFGEISLIAPSALVDKESGRTAGTWTTDAYTQRYPSVERQMSDKGYEKFCKWVDGLDFTDSEKAEIKRQATDALEDNREPAWELMYLKEKGIDIKAYSSDVNYAWEPVVETYGSVDDVLKAMESDAELDEKVRKLVKAEIASPVMNTIRNKVRHQIREETGNVPSPVNPAVRKRVREIFDNEYAPKLFDENGQVKSEDVRKVVGEMLVKYNDTKRFSFQKAKSKASTYVHNNGMYTDYLRWQEEKLEDYGTKGRIFRGYRNDGTRRYSPETLENVSKAMSEDADGETNGSEYTSFGSFIAKLAPHVDSTEEMRSSKDKLSSSEEEKKEFYDKWEDTYYALAKELYNDVFYGEKRLHDIVLQKDPKRYAKKEYGITLSASFMKNLDALKKAIREDLKSPYFETKFERPVHLDEFAAAVVPNDLGADVRKMLEESGIALYGYDPAKKGDRSRAFNEAIISSDNIRFSLRQEPAPKVTKKGYAVFIYKKLKNGGYKLVPKMLSNDPGAPAQTWLNADTGYMKRDENGEPLQNTNGRASVSVNGSQAGGNKSNKLAWRPGKHLAMYPNASQFKSPDGTIPKDVIFFEVEYAADPDLHKQYQRNAWELGMNDNGQYRNNQGGLPYIPKDSYYLYRTNSISEGATPMIITGAYKINRALTDAEAKELNQNAGGMWCPRKGGDLTEEKLKDMGLDDKGLKKMTESFDMDTIKESHDESDEARLLPGYKSREINWEDKDLIHSIEENGQDINDYRDGYVAPEHSEEPTIRFSLDKDKGTVASPSKPSKAEAVLRDAVIDRLRENGMEVITDVVEGQKVLDEANGDVREMSFGEPYDYEAYPLGRVEPNLADREVMVVRTDADHGFMNYKEAKAWAKQHVAKVYNNEETGGKGDVRISNAAIDKFMSQSAVDKSDGKDVHMSVLKVLPEVLKNSIDVETHPDFLKGADGKRRPENGMNKDVLVHRCYGAVSIDGKPYRVKITLKEEMRNKSLPHNTHSYEATKIELLAGTLVKPKGDNPNTNNSISAAKLLENVVMSYNPGEKVLDASEKRSAGLREQRVYHGSGADGVRFFRTANGEAYGFTVGGKIYVDPRIATSETPVHEYAHLWASALRSGNVEEWQNVVGLMKDSKVWDEVKGRYPELKTDDEIADEVIATYSGRRGAERLREEQRKIAEGDGGVFEKAEAISALEHVKRALKMFWKGVADFLHIHYKSAEEVADRVMKDLLEGVDPRKMGDGVDRQRYASLGVSRALGKEAAEGEPRWASLGLSEQQLDGDDTIRFSLNYDKWNREMASWLKRNRLPKNAQRPVVPQREAGESDLHFAGRLAKYNQDKALWNTAPKYEGHLSSGMTARGEFNYELQRGSVLARIAAQDSMLAIRKAQEAIARHSGLLKVGTFEDAYMAENNSHGKAKNEFEQYDQEYLEPLRKWFNVMMKRLDGSYNNVTNYMIAKHGLERNAHMAFMAALEAEAKKAIGNTQPDAKRLRAQMVHDAYRQYKADSRRLINDADYEAGKYDYAQWRRTDDAIRKSYCSNYESFRYDKGGVVRDYAGLSSLFLNETDFEEKAAELCADIESKNGHETSELWDAVRQAARQILKNSHDAGMMSDETYDYVRGMYEHYIPLRGWNDSAADEVWDYAGGGRGVFNAALKEAHGRQSLADDPVAYIMNMAESGFLVNNRNWVKQHFLTMAMNHPTDLLTVSKAWYVKTKDQFGNEVWIPASPNIPVDETDPAVIEAALNAFQTKMEQMEQSGDATQQRGSLNIEYPQTKSEEREHEVRVMKDGEEYVVYVNGDPQLAQALNNTRAMRVREHEGNFEKACAWLGRKMAAVYTSLSPLFVPSNWARDTTMTLASTAIREDARYNWLLRTKFMRPDVQMRMFGLVKEYQNGKLREKVKSRTATKTEENFWNFMINGGETGFVSTMDVDAFREKIQRDLKDMGRTRLNPVKVGHTIADSVEYINRVIEDSNRFAIYQTSIEYGRGIEEAVQDAKNVTLNFNRKGTGEMGMSAIRQLYLFINPAIQSLQTLGALAKDHKAKFTAVTSAWMASGMLVPLFNELMFNLASAAAGGGGDDDDEFNPKDEYWKFSSFDRRNNCILWIPFTHNFIKIPLAPEFRGFYGIGDMVASAMWGGENAKESWSNYAADLMGQIIDLSPLDPVSYDGNVLVSLMPNAIRPLVEIAQNVTFTGKPIYRESDFNKYDPSFKKAYAGTPDFLLRYSKWMNSIGNKYPEAQQGPVEQTAVGRYANNPAVIDHLLKSYLGGMYTLGSQIAGAITKASDEETRKDFKTADIPFFSKFVANPNDRPQSKNKGDAYWQDFEKYQRSSHTLGVIRQDARKTGNFSVLEDFYKSEEYKEMKEYEPKAKQRKEEQKYERWKEEGNADLYQPHQQTGEDVYKRHSTPADDFEDTKASILYQKIRPAKDIFDLADINTPSGMDTFNKYYDLAGKVEEAHSVKKEMNAIVKSFVNDEHKTTFDPEKMKEYRALRKQYLQLVEDGNRMFEKIKAQRN